MMKKADSAQKFPDEATKPKKHKQINDSPTIKFFPGKTFQFDS